MREKLKQIDELTEGDHYHITSSSGCFYFLEYPSGNDNVNRQNPVYSYIHNFKKKLSRKGHPDWKYKADAINKTVDLLQAYFDTRSRVSRYTLIPIPPSKIVTDPMYDDRMHQVLSTLAYNNTGIDYRNVLFNRINITASHETSQRPTIEQLKNNYFIDVELLSGSGPVVILFDDVLTTGAHFVAARDKILEVRPDLSVKGIFIARSVRPDPADDFSDLFDFS